MCSQNSTKEANGLSESSQARQRRRQERANNVGSGVVDSAAMGDMFSHYAPVVPRQLPPSAGRYVNSNVVNGSRARTEHVKVGSRKPAASVIDQSPGDRVAAMSEMDMHSDVVHSNVRLLSHSLLTFLFIFLCDISRMCLDHIR